MAWTTPMSATPGQMMTADLWNKHVRDNETVLKTSIADDGRVSGEILTHREAIVALAIAAGAVALDLTKGNSFTLALTGNVTGITISGWVAGKAHTVTLRLTQDATGGRTVALPAWRWSAGVAPVITATANKTDILVLYSDDGGANIYPSLFTANA